MDIDPSDMATLGLTVGDPAGRPVGQPSPLSFIGLTVCGYQVVGPLAPSLMTPGESIASEAAHEAAPRPLLARGPGGRPVSLKPLDQDCLVGDRSGSLHPSVRERLSRVRELALAGVANLYGVEREAGAAWLIWEYIPGKSFVDYASASAQSPLDVATAARELVLTVESLHLQGIVHGSIASGNVIVGPTRGVRLTHVSPYLYADPAEDAQAVYDLIEQAVVARRELGSPLPAMLAEARAASGEHLSLRPLATRLAAFLGSRRPSSLDDAAVATTRPHENDAGPRGRALAGAAAVTVLGIAAAWGAWQAVGRPPLAAPRSIAAPSVESRR